jgi:hypothetical protein
MLTSPRQAYPEFGLLDADHGSDRDYAMTWKAYFEAFDCKRTLLFSAAKSTRAVRSIGHSHQ